MFRLRTVTREHSRNVLVLFVAFRPRTGFLRAKSKRTRCDEVLSVRRACFGFAKSDFFAFFCIFFALFGAFHSHSLQMEKAPLLPEFLKEHDIMYSPHSSEDVFNETLLYCSQLFGTVHSADNFEVQASFGIGSTLYVSFNIYTVLFEQVELTGIYMHLLNGDYLGYQSLYRVFSERVQESYSLVPYFDQPQATKKRKLNV